VSALADDIDDLISRALGGERRALARLITYVEVAGPSARAVTAALHPRSGSAALVGITGAPGAGKSTLTDKLVGAIRDDSLRVGVLAVDPTSPFTGGAILGDRVRMQDRATDDGVFIRSMATRGHLGGLALATPHAARVLDAFGFPWILIETVGVGQVEVEVAGHADTTIVVLNPGWGDGVQAAKAGLMEIADIFVVNKADRPGVTETVRDIEAISDLAGERPWRPPVVSTVAIEGSGVAPLWQAIRDHRDFLESSGSLDARRLRRAADEIRALVVEALGRRAMERCSGGAFDALVGEVVRRERDPYSVADTLS
jgi:LAO/AO transport system kinase